jgi:hypothetical protein
MVPHFLRGLDLGRLETWVLVVSTLSFVLLAIVSTRLVWGKSAPSKPPAKPAAKPAKADVGPDPFLFGSASEKRKAMRRKGGNIEILISDEKAEAKPSSGFVLDRSLDGICLLAKVRASPGTVLTLRPAKAPPGTPWVEVKVRNCREQEDDHVLGCQFVRAPSSAVLCLFG